MEPIFILLIYVLITQPTLKLTSDIRQQLSSILLPQKDLELNAILQDNQILLDPHASILQIHSCINRHKQRLLLYLPFSSFETGSFPSLKQLSRDQVLRQERHISQPPLKNSNSLTTSLRTDLGLDDDNGKQIASLFNWIHIPAFTNNLDFLMEILLQALRENNICYRGPYDISPMHLAALLGNPELIKMFLKAKANTDLNHPDALGNTPLHYAFEAKDEQNVWTLIEAGAITNTANYFSIQPLHLATYYGRMRLLSLLLARGANVNAFGSHNLEQLLSALYYVMQRKGYSSWSRWSAFVDDIGRSWLLKDYSHMPSLKKRLEYFLGYKTPRIIAATPLAWAIEAQQEAAIKLLIKHNADIHLIAKYYGYTNDKAYLLCEYSDEDCTISSRKFSLPLFYQQAPAKIHNLLEHSACKREIKLLAQYIKFNANDEEIQLQLKKLQRWHTKKIIIDSVLKKLVQKQKYSQEENLHLEKLLQESYFAKNLPMNLKLDPQNMRQFLIGQLQKIESDLTQAKKIEFFAKSAVSSDQLNQKINKLDLPNLMACYIHYRRAYLHNQKQRNIDIYQKKLLGILRYIFIFGFTYYYINRTIIETKSALRTSNKWLDQHSDASLVNKSAYISLWMSIYIIICCVLALPLLFGIKLNKRINNYIENKLNMIISELNELNENYPIFETNSLLASIIQNNGGMRHTILL